MLNLCYPLAAKYCFHLNSVHIYLRSGLLHYESLSLPWKLQLFFYLPIFFLIWKRSMCLAFASLRLAKRSGSSFSFCQYRWFLSRLWTWKRLSVSGCNDSASATRMEVTLHRLFVHHFSRKANTRKPKARGDGYSVLLCNSNVSVRGACLCIRHSWFYS